MASAALLVFFATGCGGEKMQDAARAEAQQEIERLRAENAELPNLREENKEAQRLRAENQEIHKLRGQYQQLGQLRKENEQFRQQLAKLKAPKTAASAANIAPVEPLAEAPQPIVNIVQAFEGAALALEGQEVKEQDQPAEGDRIMVDTNAIALLIPDLLKGANATNPGPYEISGWLKSRGVRMKNYQQFNSLGITNYKIQRADPVTPK